MLGMLNTAAWYSLGTARPGNRSGFDGKPTPLNTSEVWIIRQQGAI